MEVIFNDTANPKDINEHEWALGYIRMNSWDKHFSSLTDKMRVQVTKIVKQFKTNRNWIVMISTSPTYCSQLYVHIAIAHAYTNRKTSAIIDGTDLLDLFFERDEDKKRQKMEDMATVSLLMITYIDANTNGLSRILGNLFALLRRRKLNKTYTIIEVIPSINGNESSISAALKTVLSIYGKAITELFKDGTKYLKITK